MRLARGAGRVCGVLALSLVCALLLAGPSGADCLTATTGTVSGGPTCQDIALAGTSAAGLEVFLALVVFSCGSVAAYCWLGRR